MGDWERFENGSIASMSRIVDERHVVKWWRTEAGDVDCKCTCPDATSTGWCDHLQQDVDTKPVILRLMQARDYFVKKGWRPGPEGDPGPDATH